MADTWDEKCTKHQAWVRAELGYINNGGDLTIKYIRCIASGKMEYMDDDCWTDLIAAYPEE